MPAADFDARAELARQFHHANVRTEHAAHQAIARRILEDPEAGLVANRGCECPTGIEWIAEVVRRVQQDWNHASHGSPDITNLHRAISEHIGSECGSEMSTCLQCGLDKVFQLNNARDPDINRKAEADYSTTGPLLRLIVGHMYAFTQEKLAASAIVELGLYRGAGTAIDSATGEDYMQNQNTRTVCANVLQKPAASCTPEYDTAHGFSAIRLSGVIPASRILATNSTGLGTNEHTEFVVLYGPGRVDVERLNPAHPQ